MKKEQMSVELLERALRTLPQHNALHSARNHIRRAITEIATVNGKRSKRKAADITPAEKWQLDVGSGMVMNQHAAKLSLGVINQMIGEQEKKLQELRDKQKPLDDSDSGSGLLHS